MSSNKENWEAFKDPVKQGVKNIIDSIKYEIEDTIIDMKEGNTSKGGCFKKILVWGIAIVLFLTWINSCGDNTENTTTGFVSNQFENANTEIQEFSNDNLNPADDLFYVVYQHQYAANHKIELYNFAKEHKDIISNIENASNSFLYVTVDNVLGADRYKLTSKTSKYLYNGDTKDNYADGFGVLLKYSDFGYGAIAVDGHYYNILYIGQFSDGRFNGFGLKFYEPDGNEYSVLKNECSSQPADEDYLAYYHGWINYVEYEGIFEKGRKNGLGNNYYTDLELRNYIPNIVMETTISDVQYDEIVVGNFENDKASGKCKVYTVGNLVYDGEMKNNQKHGFGYLYSNNGQLEYAGDFKNDMKDGKGTLYNEMGDIIYKGKWKDDDYR